MFGVATVVDLSATLFAPCLSSLAQLSISSLLDFEHVFVLLSYFNFALEKLYRIFATTAV
jgi:hypothetical protein